MSAPTSPAPAQQPSPRYAGAQTPGASPAQAAQMQAAHSGGAGKPVRAFGGMAESSAVARRQAEEDNPADKVQYQHADMAGINTALAEARAQAPNPPMGVATGNAQPQSLAAAPAAPAAPALAPNAVPASAPGLQPPVTQSLALAPNAVSAFTPGQPPDWSLIGKMAADSVLHDKSINWAHPPAKPASGKYSLGDIADLWQDHRSKNYWKNPELSPADWGEHKWRTRALLGEPGYRLSFPSATGRPSGQSMPTPGRFKAANLEAFSAMAAVHTLTPSPSTKLSDDTHAMALSAAYAVGRPLKVDVKRAMYAPQPPPGPPVAPQAPQPPPAAPIPPQLTGTIRPIPPQQPQLDAQGQPIPPQQPQMPPGPPGQPMPPQGIPPLAQGLRPTNAPSLLDLKGDESSEPLGDIAYDKVVMAADDPISAYWAEKAGSCSVVAAQFAKQGGLAQTALRFGRKQIPKAYNWAKTQAPKATNWAKTQLGKANDWVERKGPAKVIGAELGVGGGVVGGTWGWNEYVRPGQWRAKSLARPGVVNLGTRSLAGELDPKYLAKAVPAARQYRQQNPDIPIAQNISDKALNRQIPVHHNPDLLGASGQFDPTGDYIEVKRRPGTIPGDQRTLEHELTHGAQRESFRWHTEHAEDARAKRLLSPGASDREFVQGRTKPEYLSDPAEAEAFTAELKRKLFEQTGQLHATPDALKQWVPEMFESNTLLNTLNEMTPEQRNRYIDEIMAPKWPGLVRGQEQGAVKGASCLQAAAQFAKQGYQDADDPISAYWAEKQAIGALYSRVLPFLLGRAGRGLRWAGSKLRGLPAKTQAGAAKLRSPVPTWRAPVAGPKATMLGNFLRRTVHAPQTKGLAESLGGASLAVPVAKNISEKKGSCGEVVAAQFAKHGFQDNDKSKRFSSTGESTGLSFKQRPDDYAQGQDAWASVGKYFKTPLQSSSPPNPFKSAAHSTKREAPSYKHAVDGLAGHIYNSPHAPYLLAPLMAAGGLGGGMLLRRLVQNNPNLPEETKQDILESLSPARSAVGLGLGGLLLGRAAALSGMNPAWQPKFKLKIDFNNPEGHPQPDQRFEWRYGPEQLPLVPDQLIAGSKSKSVEAACKQAAVADKALSSLGRGLGWVGKGILNYGKKKFFSQAAQQAQRRAVIGGMGGGAKTVFDLNQPYYDVPETAYGRMGLLGANVGLGAIIGAKSNTKSLRDKRLPLSRRMRRGAELAGATMLAGAGPAKYTSLLDSSNTWAQKAKDTLDATPPDKMELFTDPEPAISRILNTVLTKQTPKLEQWVERAKPELKGFAQKFVDDNKSDVLNKLQSSLEEYREPVVKKMQEIADDYKPMVTEEIRKTLPVAVDKLTAVAREQAPAARREGIELAKNTVNTAMKEHGPTLAKNVGMMAGGYGGGGLAGYLGGGALGHAFAGDDESLSYEQRRRRERIRGIIKLLGAGAGAGLGGYGAYRMMNKQSKFLGHRNVSEVPGPDQISQAINMLAQARMMAVPPPSYLSARGLSPEHFESTIGRLAQSPDNKLNAKNLRENPKHHGIGGGILGAGAGVGLAQLGGGGIGETLGMGALGGGVGALGGYLRAQGRNERLLNTMKVLKDYGLLNRSDLRRAMPLLKQDKEGAWKQSSITACAAKQAFDLGFGRPEPGEAYNPELIKQLKGMETKYTTTHGDSGKLEPDEAKALKQQLGWPWYRQRPDMTAAVRELMAQEEAMEFDAPEDAAKYWAENPPNTQLPVYEHLGHPTAYNAYAREQLRESATRADRIKAVRMNDGATSKRERPGLDFELKGTELEYMDQQDMKQFLASPGVAEALAEGGYAPEELLAWAKKRDADEAEMEQLELLEDFESMGPDQLSGMLKKPGVRQTIIDSGFDPDELLRHVAAQRTQGKAASYITPFAHGFLTKCANAGLEPAEVGIMITKLADTYDDATIAELRDGLYKSADIRSKLGPGAKWLGNTVLGGAKSVLGGAKKVLGFGGRAMGGGIAGEGVDRAAARAGIDTGGAGLAAGTLVGGGSGFSNPVSKFISKKLPRAAGAGMAVTTADLTDRAIADNTPDALKHPSLPEPPTTPVAPQTAAPPPPAETAAAQAAPQQRMRLRDMGARFMAPKVQYGPEPPPAPGQASPPPASPVTTPPPAPVAAAPPAPVAAAPPAPVAAAPPAPVAAAEPPSTSPTVSPTPEAGAPAPAAVAPEQPGAIAPESGVVSKIKGVVSGFLTGAASKEQLFGQFKTYVKENPEAVAELFGDKEFMGAISKNPAVKEAFGAALSGIAEEQLGMSLVEARKLIADLRGFRDNSTKLAVALTGNKDATFNDLLPALTGKLEQLKGFGGDVFGAIDTFMQPLFGSIPGMENIGGMQKMMLMFGGLSLLGGGMSGSGIMQLAGGGALLAVLLPMLLKQMNPEQAPQGQAPPPRDTAAAQAAPRLAPVTQNP